MKPVIGIVPNYLDNDLVYCLKEHYAHAVIEAGGVPVIIPPAGEETGEDYLAFCHGLLLSGGGDVDPVYWGELPSGKLGRVSPLRDVFEISLVRLALAYEIPVLGICRGCQVLNIALGGSINQDIDTGMCHQQNAPRNYGIHDIFIERDSRLGLLTGTSSIRVNSFHHQAVDRIGRNLRVTAWAPDGTVEAIEGSSGNFVLGVQWHPECLQDYYSSRLFAALVQAAAYYQTRWKTYRQDKKLAEPTPGSNHRINIKGQETE